MRWVVTGSGGMLGSDLVDVLRDAGEEVDALDRRALDVTDPDACSDRLAGADVVVNAAAWTDVDGAETAEGRAFAVNAVGAGNVARAAREAGAALVHVSTDYVFDGSATEPYPVTASLRPLNAYGRGKAAGEWAVRAEHPQAHVVRTAWLYGAHGRSFVRTVLELATSRDTVDVVTDQHGQATWTRDLAAFVLDLVRSGTGPGVHHGTSTGEASWYDVAREAFAVAGHDPDRVRPTTSAQFPRPAARPAYSVLANDGRLPAWQDGLARAVPLLVPTAR